MENRKNLCAMIPEALHTQARTEQEQMNLTLSQYVEMVLKEHFENGGKKMANGTTRTLAFQISEELFGRIKAHLKATGLSQKDRTQDGCPQETGGGRKAVQEPDIIQKFIKEAVSCIFTLTI